jgi:hypothetical protein
MKNVILSLAIALFLLNGGASAQIVTQYGDSSKVQYTGGSTINAYNGIKSGSSNNVVIRWNVMSATFGTGWSGDGICDNYKCYTSGDNVYGGLTSFVSNPYDNSAFPSGSINGSTHDFHSVFAVDNSIAPNNSYSVVRVSAMDTVGKTSRTLTFIAYKGSLKVETFSSSDDVVLFPNPARDAVNVIYDDKAGVRTIAVYNLIGKLMGPIYKPSSNSSAKIDLDDMPTGIYFLRLMDGQGRVVATRRFTRQ